MSKLYDAVSQYLPFARKKPKVSKEDLLSLRPLRNAQLKWERGEDGESCLFVPRRTDLVARMLCRIFHAPPHKRVILDEVGAEIWELCDGQHSVDAIISAESRRYKMTRRECEASVSMYLKMLGERNLVGFLPQDIRKTR